MKWKCLILEESLKFHRILNWNINEKWNNFDWKSKTYLNDADHEKFEDITGRARVDRIFMMWMRLTGGFLIFSRVDLTASAVS